MGWGGGEALQRLEGGNCGVCGGPPARQQCPTTSRHGHGRRATFRALSSACSRLQVPWRTAVVASLHGPDISTAHGAYKLMRLHKLGEGSEGNIPHTQGL